MKRIIFVAEPSSFDLQDQWFVIAHNLDDAGDVEKVAGPFTNQADADAEARRLQNSGAVGSD
jgi:hypothetical protein